MNDDRSLHEEERDPTITSLLNHLKGMRETVPINYQLKAELKKKLMAQMMAIKTAQPVEPNKLDFPKRPKWQIYSWLLAVMGLIGLMVSWLQTDVSIRQLEALQGSQFENASLVQLAPKEDHLALLVNQDIIVLDEDRKRTNRIALPLQQESVASLAWSPQGDQWAWIKNTPSSSQVWASHVQGAGSRLIAEVSAEKMEGIAWSPDGKELYTSIDNRVWMISTVSPRNKMIYDGTYPAPSPDGEHLAVVVNGQIQVINLLGETLAEVSEGLFPQWIDEKTLLFLDPQGRVMKVNPFSADEPKVALNLTQESPDNILGLQISGDGQRLLIEWRTAQGKVWKQGEVWN